MRVSALLLVTLRDDPAEAEIASHKLLLRGGYIRRVASGIYAYLPLMWRVLRKVMGSGALGAAIVVFDRDNQFVEQVAAPVNVADDVVALALGHFRQNLCRFAFAEQSGEFDHGENRWFSAGSTNQNDIAWAGLEISIKTPQVTM